MLTRDSAHFIFSFKHQMPGTDLRGKSYGQGIRNVIVPFKGEKA